MPKGGQFLVSHSPVKGSPLQRSRTSLRSDGPALRNRALFGATLGRGSLTGLQTCRATQRKTFSVRLTLPAAVLGGRREPSAQL